MQPGYPKFAEAQPQAQRGEVIMGPPAGHLFHLKIFPGTPFNNTAEELEDMIVCTQVNHLSGNPKCIHHWGQVFKFWLGCAHG